MHGRRVLDVVETVLRPAVGQYRDLCLGAGKPGREQYRVRAAGDVHGGIRMLCQDRPEQLQDFLCVINVYIQKPYPG